MTPDSFSQPAIVQVFASAITAKIALMTSSFLVSTITGHLLLAGG
jgi:hypothetical protein